MLRARLLAVALTVVALAPLLSPLASASTTPLTSMVEEKLGELASRLSTLEENVTVYEATLITGDRVVAVKGPYGWSVSVAAAKPGRSFLVMESAGTVYVVPTDVDLSRFDVELFNLARIHEYRELGLNGTPIIVKLRLEPEGLEATLSRLKSTKLSIATILDWLPT
jgi:hypothetical protein